MRRLRLAGGFAGGIIGMAVLCSSSLAALPAGYGVQRIDDPSPAIDGRFGQNIAGVGDVNGDGYEDVLAGTDKHGRLLGQVSLIAGDDGSVFRELQLPDIDAGGSGERASGFGAAVGKIGADQASGPFFDIGSCPSGDGADGDAVCDDANVGAADGIPDLLVTASGVDVNPTTGAIDASLNNDLGVAYVFDGDTGALLKRLLMPQGDRETAVAIADSDPRFGRAALSPGGLFPCDENGNDEAGGGNGISHDANSSCPAVPMGVRAGDLDGGGTADIVVAATDFDEEAPNTNANSPCAVEATGTDCPSAGRVYVWFGESIDSGTTSGAVDDTPDITIKDLYSSPEGGTRIGTTLIPVGDLGNCPSPPTDPAEFCAAPSTTTDGRPDYVATGPDYDIAGAPGAGNALLIDGDTGAILKQYDHPEPQTYSAWGLAQNGLVQPAFGNLGQSNTWDVYVPGTHQNEGGTAVGKGYIMNGQLSARERFINFSQLWDPTPKSSGNFGASAGGLGDVFGVADGGTAQNEVIVGAIGPHAPGTNPNVINDVHIFNPIDEQVLQSFDDPDDQPGATFGGGVVPLGDVNDDGFMDVAISSGLHDLTQASGPCSAAPCANAGRVYVFRSDDTTPEPPPDNVAAGRALVLDANRTTVAKGKRVRLIGVLEAFANEAACVPGQEVQLQRRRPGNPSYATFATKTTDVDGGFQQRVRVRRTTIFRAKAPLTDDCLGAVSEGVRVTVR